MHGAPSRPGSAEAGPTPEDLDSVLSRFQKWSSGPLDSKSGSPSSLRRATPSKKVNLAAGARELSYEQALHATSHPRPGYQTHLQPASPLPPAAQPAAAEPSAPGSEAMACEKSSSAFAAKDPSKRPPKTPKIAQPQPRRRERVAASPAVQTATAVSGETPAPQSEMPLNVPLTSLPTGRRKRAGKAGPRPPVGRGRRNHRPNLAATVPVDPVFAEAAQLEKSTPSGMSKITHSAMTHSAIVQPAIVQPAIVQPAFREVLQQSAGLTAAPKDGVAFENKTIALSLRVSDAEQARIQACAARANVSVSAYLRQCALGVEELRDQVALALGELRKQDAPQATPPPGLSAIPQILRQVAVGWFRRLRGNRNDTGLSLR